MCEPEVFVDGEKVSAEVFNVSENNPGEPAQSTTRERGLILSEDNAMPIAGNGLMIEICSLAEWLLQPSPVS